MNQDQQSRPWWERNRLASVSTVLGVSGLVIITILGYLLNWEWTELLWRWLELLIIPLVLALGALWFNNQARKSEQELARRERENDRAIADDRVREEALQRYLDRMSELVLDKKLRESKRGDTVRATAGARTLTVLRYLDGTRRGAVMSFLYESDLIGKVVTEESGKRRVIEAIIDLNRAAFVDAGLSNENLSGADLHGAVLFDTRLVSANLSDTNLSDAILFFADLRSASLDGADLSGASLGDANLSGVNLSRANLSGAKHWTNQQLAQAESLVGATMPDGTVMTEEAWEEFKKRYRTKHDLS